MAAPTSTPQTAADHRRGHLLALAAVMVPWLLYLLTASAAVQFDDGAQFVLVAHELSTAHPPGFPLWTTIAGLWQGLFGFLPTMTAVCAWVATTSALASALLFLAFDSLLARPFAGLRSHRLRHWAAFGAAMACATGATVWQWSNSAEVYALQWFATALLLFGLARDDGGRKWQLVAGVGLGIGLANHHVSTVLLLPFLPSLLVLTRGLRWPQAARALLPAAGLGAALAAAAYLWMMLRATGDVAFTFGEPSTLSRLWHHLSGGFFGDSMWRPGVDYGGRASVLSMVAVRHLWLFALPFALGLAAAWRTGRGLLVLALGYPALLLLLQFGRMHTPNMDAGLLPALAVLSLLTALGLARLAVAANGGRNLLLLLTAGLALQLTLNYDAANRRGYAAVDAVLADVDGAAPERSVLLLTNWELQTATLLARELHDFRPDLILLPSNLKGTHRDLLARRHPEFHAAVRAEYEAYLAAVAAVDPDYVYTDYARLETPDLVRTYVAMLRQVLAVAAAEQRPVLCDVQTFRLLDGLGKDPSSKQPVAARMIVRPDQVSTSGILFSIGNDTVKRPLQLQPGWLEHPFLMHDLCAQGMLHDYKTAARQMAAYWRNFRRDAAMAAPAEAAATRLEAIWNEYLVGKPAPRK